jgi:predicted permease
MVGQVAMTTVLLIGTGLFGHALHKAQSVDVGFRVDGLVNADLDLGPRGYEDARAQQVAAAVLAEVRARPGVEAAALARVLPLTMSSMSLGVVVDGTPIERALSPAVNVVSDGWFETLGIPIVGRGFRSDDVAGREDVAVINRQLAERLFGAGDALGRSFRYGEPDAARTLRVVGIAGDGRHASWHEDPEPFLYLPLAQWPTSELNVVARTALPPADATATVVDAMLAVDPDLPRPQVHAMTDTVAISLLPQRLAGLVSALLGALGLLLAALGLYALVAQHVAARTREIGVRLSLGASPSRIAREVAGRGARLLGVGAALGLLLALALARFAEGVLFGVDAGDGIAFAAALGLLAAVGLAACLPPARRAARIEPSVALRQD